MPDNKQIAQDVLAAVGGKDNVTSVVHCMTRLRFTLKDAGMPDTNQVKKIKGVIGVQESGGQYQIIVGQNVPEVYAQLCKLGGFESQTPLDESLDGPGFELTPKGIGTAILNYLSGSVVPMIPVFVCAGFFKTVAMVLGPQMLHLVEDTNDLVVLMNMLFNAAFYFMPIYLGYNAAKTIGVTPVLGAFMGGIFLEPTFAQMAAEGTPFTVYGIPCQPGSYAQTVLPILLTVAVMCPIERFFKRVMPDTLTTVFTPFLTMAVTVPIGLCLMGPIGSWLGAGMSAFFTWLGNAGGIVTILGAGLLAALWLPMVVTGTAWTLTTLALVNFTAVGSDNFVYVATMISLWAGYGCELASWIKLRDKGEKAQALGYFISNFIGGVGEPFIYGLVFRYPRLFVCNAVSSFITGAVAAILGVTFYVYGLPSNVLTILSYTGGSASNLVCAGIAAAVGVVAGFLITFFFGFTEDELEHGPASERA